MANKILQELYAASLESENDDLHPESKNEATDDTGKGKPEMVIDVETVDETYKEGKVPKGDVEVVEKTRESMEAIMAAVESSLEDGGLDKASLSLARITVENLAGSMAVEPAAIASFEAFDGEEVDRVAATQAALESMRPAVAQLAGLESILRERIEEE